MGIVGLHHGEVNNDATLELYQKVVAEAGADMVAPSGMMDGQVAAIHKHLTQTDMNNSRSWRIQLSTPLLNMDRFETQ